jgi:acetyl/propionyl-CoA carboxylase alpha subunit
MIGKIIVWGRTRAEALARSRRAISETVIEGTRTTLPFHRWLLGEAAFVSGEYDTAYLSKHFHTALPPDAVREEREAAALAAVFAALERSVPVGGVHAGGASGGAGASRWRDAIAAHRAAPERSWK